MNFRVGFKQINYLSELYFFEINLPFFFKLFLKKIKKNA